jgi:hypothetical protein
VTAWISCGVDGFGEHATARKTSTAPDKRNTAQLYPGAVHNRAPDYEKA